MSRSRAEQLDLDFNKTYPKTAGKGRIKIPGAGLMALNARTRLRGALQPKTLKLSVGYLPERVVGFINSRLKMLSDTCGSGVRLQGKITEGELGRFEISAAYAEEVCRILSSSDILGFSAMVSCDCISIFRDPLKQEGPQESLGGGIKKK